GQLKIRGYRVELGEVEAVVASHPDVHQAAVVANDDEAVGRQLIAFLVPVQRGRPSVRELREYVADRLPEYMTPTLFVHQQRLPLTPKGKVDRQALLASHSAVPHVGRPPRSPQEALLCELFGEVLGLPQVGFDDNFFELGGNSLGAIRLATRVR